MRHDSSKHSSQYDEDEHDFRPRRGQRWEAFGNHAPRRDNDEEEHGFILRWCNIPTGYYGFKIIIKKI